MSLQLTILLKMFVRPFYRENAGTLFFMVTVMFLCVGPLNGASVIEYHYSLIMGMLHSLQFMVIVCIIWLLYARKCAAFVVRTLFNPSSLFLRTCNGLHIGGRYALMIAVQTLLLAPVLLYGLVVIGIAWWHHLFASSMLLALFFVILCTLPAWWYVRLLLFVQPPAAMKLLHFDLRGTVASYLASSYPMVLIRFMLTDQKMIIAGIKLFTCGVLYGMVKNNTATDYESEFPFLFSTSGLLQMESSFIAPGYSKRRP